MPHFGTEFSSPNLDFRLRHRRSLLDTDYVTLLTEHQGGCSEYVIHKRIDAGTLEAINPLELLDTRTAVNVLVKLKETPGSNVNSWVLSRLLVQTLEYSRNRKHLIADPWDEQTLRGDQLTQIANTDLAKDLKTEQRNEYKLIRSTGVAPENIEADYWTAFSKLPRVEDSFEDSELQSFADQMLERLTARLNADGLVEVADIRRAINKWWVEYFDDFDLQTIKRNRRKLFQHLMSVAVRQVSTMLERIALAIVLRDASEEDRATSLFKSDREQKLFELRYGALPALGKINIGFLYDCGELHASLINDLAFALVHGETDEAWNSAEAKLQEHVHLLGSVRKKATQIEAERKAERRGRYASRKPAPTVQAEIQADPSATNPSDTVELDVSIHDELEAVIPFLKKRDQDKVRAYIKSGGELEVAAKEVGLTKNQFKRRWKETVLKNIRKAVNQTALNE